MCDELIITSARTDVIEGALRIGAALFGGDVRNLTRSWLLDAGLTEVEASACRVLIEVRQTPRAGDIIEAVKNIAC